MTRNGRDLERNLRGARNAAGLEVCIDSCLGFPMNNLELRAIEGWPNKMLNSSSLCGIDEVLSLLLFSLERLPDYKKAKIISNPRSNKGRVRYETKKKKVNW